MHPLGWSALYIFFNAESPPYLSDIFLEADQNKLIKLTFSKAMGLMPTFVAINNIGLKKSKCKNHNKREV